MNRPIDSNYESNAIEILRDLTQDWDTGLEDEITASTAIVADLDFDSLDVVHLITAIEQHYGQPNFPFEELLMVDGSYVQDLTVDEIARFVGKHLSNNRP